MHAKGSGFCVREGVGDPGFARYGSVFLWPAVVLLTRKAAYALRIPDLQDMEVLSYWPVVAFRRRRATLML